jgi:response regulator of citrate/malate metabolism
MADVDRADIGVLVVEDDPVVAAAHRSYVQRVPGFAVTAVALDGASALRALTSSGVDLVLLDLHLPDQHGLDVLRAMRAAGHTADVVAVTSARDLDVVRAAVSQGVVQYLLKPFTFAGLRDKLERYADYRSQLAGDVVSGQHEVDRVLGTLRGNDSSALPKGMSRESLDAVVTVLRAGEARSAAEVAADLGASRVTARRYLEHLAETGLATRRSRYGGTGRPEVEYRWTAQGAPPAT